MQQYLGAQEYIIHIYINVQLYSQAGLLSLLLHIPVVYLGVVLLCGHPAVYVREYMEIILTIQTVLHSQVNVSIYDAV